MMSVMTAARLDAILSSAQPAWEKDKAFWAYTRKVDYPLCSYDEDTWERCVNERQPSACAISDMACLLRHIEDAWEGHDLTIRSSVGSSRVSISLIDPSLPHGVKGAFQGAIPLSQIGTCTAIAFLRAHEMALSLRARIATVEGIQAAPYQDWPIEEVEAGRYGAVCHDLRLLCATANSPEGAARHVELNHKGDYGLLLCRERYERSFPPPEPEPGVGPQF